MPNTILDAKTQSLAIDHLGETVDSDDEIKQELIDAFIDLSEDVEECLQELREENFLGDKELLNRLFRAIHSIKGNAGMMQYTKIVDFAHAIEDVAGSLREQRYECTNAICEILLVGMDRLRDLHFRDVLGKAYENLQEDKLKELFSAIAHADDHSVSDCVDRMLNFLGGGVENIDREVKPVTSPVSHDFPSVFVELSDEKIRSDLNFFHELALQVDSQTDSWFGRSFQMFEWALKVNKIAGNTIKYEQLSAAIYMHDVGLTFLPKRLFDNIYNLSGADEKIYRAHPHWGYNYLNRIPGWEEAAIMVLDHHECIDGSGFPNGKHGNEIHPGARLLSIIDTFFSLLHSKADRNSRKSVLRAISEINSGAETRFDGMWIQCFNHMVRDEVKSGLL